MSYIKKIYKHIGQNFSVILLALFFFSSGIKSALITQLGDSFESNNVIKSEDVGRIALTDSNNLLKIFYWDVYRWVEDDTGGLGYASSNSDVRYRLSNGGKVLITSDEDYWVSGIGEAGSVITHMKRMNPDTGKDTWYQVSKLIGDEAGSFGRKIQLSDDGLSLMVNHILYDWNDENWIKRSEFGGTLSGDGLSIINREGTQESEDCEPKAPQSPIIRSAFSISGWTGSSWDTLGGTLGCSSSESTQNNADISHSSNERTFVYGYSGKGGRDPSTGELHDGYYCFGLYMCHGLVKVFSWNENGGVWTQSSEDIIGKTGYDTRYTGYGSYRGESLGGSVAITNQGDLIAASFNAETRSKPNQMYSNIEGDELPGIRFFKRIG